MDIYMYVHLFSALPEKWNDHVQLDVKNHGRSKMGGLMTRRFGNENLDLLEWVWSVKMSVFDLITHQILFIKSSPSHIPIKEEAFSNQATRQNFSAYCQSLRWIRRPINCWMGTSQSNYSKKAIHRLKIHVFSFNSDLVILIAKLLIF